MSAALEATKLGFEAVVLEREPRVGGLCGTHERNGFRFDFGGHRFITQDPEIDALVNELVGVDLLERQRSSVVLNGGKRYRYPLELDDVLRQYGVARGASALSSYLKEQLRRSLRPGPDSTFREWVTHRFGPDLYETFFGPYTAKLWGVSPDQISSDWASQRISLPSLIDVLLRLMHIPRPPARTYARNYRYPRRGIGQIFERCGEEIVARGGTVVTAAEVVSLGMSGRRVRSVRYRDVRGDHDLPCDAVISSISLPVLAHLLGEPSKAVDRSARRLRFRAIRLLNVLLEGPPVSRHTWMYVSEPDYLMARIQEPIHRSPEMAPAGATSLMLEIPCDVGDAVWDAPESVIYDICMDDLRRLGFPDVRTRTRDYFSSYVREGYPIYHVGYGADRRAILGHVEGFEGIVSCGRQGAFRYIFMDTAMRMGVEAARAIAGGGSAKAVSEIGAEPVLREARALTA